jgi:hypothetical protein
MNEKEINEDFDREYDKYKNNPEYTANVKVVTDTTTHYYKIKMPSYYIAKHSDEDLRAAVLAEREACAKLIEDIEIRKTTYSGWLLRIKKEYADAIRGRTE